MDKHINNKIKTNFQLSHEHCFDVEHTDCKSALIAYTTRNVEFVAYLETFASFHILHTALTAGTKY